jgi:hypothetical protein
MRDVDRVRGLLSRQPSSHARIATERPKAISAKMSSSSGRAGLVPGYLKNFGRMSSERVLLTLSL